MPALCPLALSVAERATANGLKMSFKPKTLLSLIGGEYQDLVDLAEGETKEELRASVESIIQSQTPSPFAKVSLEDEDVAVLGDGPEIATHAVVDDILPIAKAIVDKTRNIFIPLVNDLYEEAFEKTLNSVQTGGILLSETTDGMENPIWKATALTGLLESIPEAGGQNTEVEGFTFPEISSDVLMTLLEETDNALLSSVKTVYGDDYGNAVQALYRRHFLKTDADSFDYYGYEAPYLLLGILLTNQFMNDIPEGVKGGGDDLTYSQAVSYVRYYFAERLRYLIDRSDRATDAGQLVMSYPAEGSAFRSGATIVLNGRLLPEWIDALGGSIDTIYGAYVSDGERNGDALLSKRGYYERQYATFIATARQTQLHSFETQFVKHLYAGIVAFSKEHNLSMAQAGIDKMFTRESAVTEDTAYSFARKAIAHILFPEEDFVTICNHIDHMFERVENIELSDAIPLAITDWLIDWAVSQINLH